MLRLSKLADYAVVTLVQLGRHQEVVTSSALAGETGVPEPTVAKVLKTLAADGLVQSQRGARGGYRLGLPLDQISVAQVIRAVDGPIALTACVSGGSCDSGAECGVCGSWDMVNDEIQATLGRISLAAMMVHRSPDKGAAGKGIAGKGVADGAAAGGANAGAAHAPTAQGGGDPVGGQAAPRAAVPTAGCCGGQSELRAGERGAGNCEQRCEHHSARPSGGQHGVRSGRGADEQVELHSENAAAIPAASYGG